jgi:hypothetical protein
VKQLRLLPHGTFERVFPKSVLVWEQVPSRQKRKVQMTVQKSTNTCAKNHAFPQSFRMPDK